MKEFLVKHQRAGIFASQTVREVWLLSQRYTESEGRDCFPLLELVREGFSLSCEWIEKKGANPAFESKRKARAWLRGSSERGNKSTPRSQSNSPWVKILLLMTLPKVHPIPSLGFLWMLLLHSAALEVDTTAVLPQRHSLVFPGPICYGLSTVIYFVFIFQGQCK